VKKRLETTSKVSLEESLNAEKRDLKEEGVKTGEPSSEGGPSGGYVFNFPIQGVFSLTQKVNL